MKLNIPERLALLGVLPQQGNAATLRVIRELQSELSFSEEETEHFSITNHQLPDGRATINWNPELTKETKDIKIGKTAKKTIIRQLERLDRTEQLHVSMMPIYDMFIEPESEKDN